MSSLTKFSKDYVSTLQIIAEKRGETVEKLYKEHKSFLRDCVLAILKYKKEEGLNPEEKLLSLRIERNEEINNALVKLREINNYSIIVNFNLSSLRTRERGIHAEETMRNIAWLYAAITSTEVQRLIRECQ